MARTEAAAKLSVTMRREHRRALRLCVLAALAAAASRRPLSLGLSGLAAVPLLGGGTPWLINDWRQETDAVRGGASKVSLKMSESTDVGVELSGDLDPSQLGAAFAGMALQEKTLPKPLTDFRGLVVDVAKSDGLEYSVSLRMRGAVAGHSHKFRFKPDGPGKVEMPFKEFVPIFRGKPAPQPAPPLDPARVDMVVLQAASDFAKQEGPFSLTLRALEGLEGEFQVEQPKEAPARETRWKCPACDTLQFKGATNCERCGSPQVVLKGKGAAKPEKPKKWECVDCGTANFPGSAECFKCGAQKS